MKSKITIDPKKLKKARAFFGDSQSQLAQMAGYARYQRIAEIENGSKHPGPSATKILFKYIRLAAEIEKEGGCRCPNCGWWTRFTTGKKNEDDEYEMVCHECGNQWFA